MGRAMDTARPRAADTARPRAADTPLENSVMEPEKRVHNVVKHTDLDRSACDKKGDEMR